MKAKSDKKKSDKKLKKIKVRKLDQVELTAICSQRDPTILNT
jgi:hypothetical protein